MGRTYRKQKGQSKRKRAGREIARGLEEAGAMQLVLDRGELMQVLQDGLDALMMNIGLTIAQELLDDEVLGRCGRRHERQPTRTETRHGSQRGVVTMCGQKVPVDKPRVRTVAAGGRGQEVELDVYKLLQREDAMPEAVLRRMVRGVSCRDYEAVIDQARDGFGVERSSVSRHFVRATTDRLKDLGERPLDERFVVIYVDGLVYAGQTIIVALGVTLDGKKVILGLRQGATENATVCKDLLADLQRRGVNAEQPTLFVIDGAKALRSAIGDVWGARAVVQRCQQHKRSNVKDYVPEQHWAEVKRRLDEAYNEASYDGALKSLKATARWLDQISPDGAASLREGMEETLTVIKLGLEDEWLRRTLSTTNPIESAISIARTVTGRVKRWRDGNMRKRWCAAGLLRAEQKFRRIKGHRHLPALVLALEKLVEKMVDAQRKAA
jgi:putative transposase